NDEIGSSTVRRKVSLTASSADAAWIKESRCFSSHRPSLLIEISPRCPVLRLTSDFIDGAALFQVGLHDLTYLPQAFGADFVQRIRQCMVIRIVEINYIHSTDTFLNERDMIVGQTVTLFFDKIIRVAQIPRNCPDRLHQIRRAFD